MGLCCAQAFSGCGMWALLSWLRGSLWQCSTFPRMVPGLLLWSVGSRAHRLSRLNSCGTLASLVAVHGRSCPMACGILVTQPGIEPASLALEGRFLTTGPPGKSFPSYSFLFLIFVVDGCLFTRVSEFISAESIWLSSSKIRVFSLIINLYYKYLFFSPGEIFTLNLDKNLSSKQLWNVGWCNKPG